MTLNTKKAMRRFKIYFSSFKNGDNQYWHLESILCAGASQALADILNYKCNFRNWWGLGRNLEHFARDDIKL